MFSYGVEGYPKIVLDKLKQQQAELEIVVKDGRNAFLLADYGRGKTTLMKEIVNKFGGVLFNLELSGQMTAQKVVGHLAEDVKSLDALNNIRVVCVDELSTIIQRPDLVGPIVNFVNSHPDISWVFAVHPKTLDVDQIKKFMELVTGSKIRLE